MKTKTFITRDPQTSVTRILKELDLNSIGAGCYGEVYGSDEFPDRVFKIGKIERNQSYLRYVKEAAETSNPHVPQFYKLEYYKTDPDRNTGYFLLEMERLSELRDHPACRQLAATVYTIDTALSHGTTDKMTEPLVEIIKIIRAAGESFDLHLGNAMVRSCGTLVITDPLSY